jgi:hypothetical protein
VLHHIRETLALKLEDLTVQTFRDEGAFAPWKDDADFVKLYAQYEKPEAKNQ